VEERPGAVALVLHLAGGLVHHLAGGLVHHLAVVLREEGLIPALHLLVDHAHERPPQRDDLQAQEVQKIKLKYLGLYYLQARTISLPDKPVVADK